MRGGYSAEEMRRYWRLHSRQWQDLDREADPEGLTNVCFNGAPLWLNRFAALQQRRTFLDLLRSVGPIEGRRALDVGCGTARWSGLLSQMGARVTGIDLQSESLRIDRRRWPACRFAEMTADALGFADRSFDLAVTVTVLQHMPHETQAVSLRELRRILVPGGHLMMLEATRDRAAHVFSHPARDWVAGAASHGFALVRARPYDYAPLIYGMRGLSGLLRRTRQEDVPSVEQYVARFHRKDDRLGAARRLYRAGLRAATALSYPLEPVFAAIAPSSSAYHVGLLLRAV